jgi:hypothetical protein
MSRNLVPAFTLTVSAFIFGVGCSGADGINGARGASVTVTPEPAGAHCANGGANVRVGMSPPAYVCSGGANGGQTATVATEPAGSNCASGGVRYAHLRL